MIAQHRETGLVPYLLPLSVDGLIAVLSVSLFDIANQVRTPTTPPSGTPTSQPPRPAAPEPVTPYLDGAPTERNLGVPDPRGQAPDEEPPDDDPDDPERTKTEPLPDQPRTRART